MISSDENIDFRLKFKPSSVEVQVEDLPVTNILFEQIKYSASGSIQCKYFWFSNNLLNLAQSKENLKIIIENSRIGYSKNLQVEGGKYKIKDILPGKYKVTVDKPEYCWEKEVVYFQVGDQDKSDIVSLFNVFTIL